MQNLALTLILLTVVTCVSSARAESSQRKPIPEILVVGEFRTTELNRLPSSISVFDEKLIEARSAEHLEDLLGVAPNVNFTSGASRARYFQIRGIGERGQFAEPLNASVGLLIDDVDFSGIGTIASLFDVDQVEIYRGPQGTRYGANALAGLISIHTRDPAPETEGSVILEMADYATYGVGAVASGPVTERLLYRLGVQSYRSDGFVHNEFLGRNDTNNRDELTLRGKLRWEANASTSVDLTLGYIDFDNGYDAFSLDNQRDTLSDEPGHDKQQSVYLNTHVTLDSFDRFTLQTILSFAGSDIGYSYDEDWTYLGFDPAGYSSTDNYGRNRDTYTAELRLVSRQDQRLFSDSTDWVMGIYSLHQVVNLTRKYTFLSENFSSDYQIDRVAVYGQTDTFLSDATMLSIGLRLENHQSDYADSNSVAFKPEDHLWGGRFSLEHLLNDQTMVYASVSRGYKAGGFNTDGTLDADLRQFDPEVLWNYEVGIKGSWLADHLNGRLSVFSMQRDDVQISSSLVRVRSDGSAEFIDYTGNAAQGSNTGLELELTWQPNTETTISGSLGLLNTEYRNFINQAGENLEGRDQAQAPRYQFSLGIDYRFSDVVSAGIQLEGKDSYYFSDSHAEKSPAYVLFHANIQWHRESWIVNLWGRNLADKDYFVRGFYFGNDPRIGYADRGYTQLGEPRRVGITLKREF